MKYQHSLVNNLELLKLTSNSLTENSSEGEQILSPSLSGSRSGFSIIGSHFNLKV